ncbi:MULTISPECIES: glycine--tRNA ligase subunit beta [unclassified Rhizobacter]|uniref:glycine--tRNA ligase subunit beta n=1 Tax=unclassified Rhizobacter TaxID=2640088 RepID=UPI0006F6772A|nr:MULTISPECIES: glycine--tRNA ligase subunit beta [unclassified Rhizobacter]KQU67179.1 glycine--tRNA ligase subunit beta [Rhizobacter sp. Root29]KQV98110.1 glycine--tRNA ligase subunit beta [Rhizobacter sp. Root1238]KRB02008.1 glycine--tRNA ligase subunit beta [Rhizobacter sp. Root16D2]
MSHKNLLVELFVEELPPKDLKRFGESFSATLFAGLKARGLATDHSAVTAYATPRRLAAHVSAVRAQADDRAVSLKLMPVSVGLTPDGQATPALLKKLASVGADASVLPQLKRQPDGKAEALFYDSLVKGPMLAEGLQQALDEALAGLPIRKVMQYQLADGWSSVNFVRPAHGLVALHGADVVPLQALGLTSGRETRGHRFEAAVEPVVLLDADHYARQLEEQGAVIASFAARHAEIVRQLDHAAKQQGLQPIDDAALLDEVTALVERPNVLLCRFEPEFLDVPQECLILTMKANQKYFPLLDAAGKLTNQFLVVSNIRPADASRVTGGNERVVRPRLADAKFFFDQDRKKSLADRVGGLDKVVYHGKLGSQGERVQRVRAIAAGIAKQVGADAVQADRAALLAKADLLTDMVGEFPELQGIMGGYYARHDGETNDVALAVEDHYKPRFAGDELPRGQVGEIVALADKLETLVGLFGIGQLPTGDKDPFALRRHALGVIRLLTERQLALPLDTLLHDAAQAFGDRITDASAALSDFIYERLAGVLREQGATAQQVDAVLSLRPKELDDVGKKLAAVRAFAALPESESLAAANKRVSNILKKADGEVIEQVDAALLADPAEKALHAALVDIERIARPAFDRRDFTASLQALAALKAPVDAFFDQVMVNADDPKIRANRLGLLATLRSAMNRVADLSRLAA